MHTCAWERLYGCPVLLSGLASLVLSFHETSVIHHHHKVTLQRLQRLHFATPECVVYFLGGSLPATGILHLRMLSLLGMIARLGPDHILQKHGRHILLHQGRENVSHSWFTQIRTISMKYSLPDPLLVLQTPPSASRWSRLTRAKVTDWWQVHLRGEADLLSSLEYFKPSFMSLSSPHPIWLSAGSPFEVRKAVVTARMLSGRYKTDRLCRHWTTSNPNGLCRLPGCVDSPGDLLHILLHCPALSDARAKAICHWSAFMVPRPWLLPIVANYTLHCDDRLQLQFLLDPSCLPLVIASSQANPEVLNSCLYLARTWNFTIHLARERFVKLLNLKT